MVLMFYSERTAIFYSTTHQSLRAAYIEIRACVSPAFHSGDEKKYIKEHILLWHLEVREKDCLIYEDRLFCIYIWCSYSKKPTLSGEEQVQLLEDTSLHSDAVDATCLSCASFQRQFFWGDIAELPKLWRINNFQRHFFLQNMKEKEHISIPIQKLLFFAANCWQTCLSSIK